MVRESARLIIGLLLVGCSDGYSPGTVPSGTEPLTSVSHHPSSHETPLTRHSVDAQTESEDTKGPDASSRGASDIRLSERVEGDIRRQEPLDGEDWREPADSESHGTGDIAGEGGSASVEDSQQTAKPLLDAWGPQLVERGRIVPVQFTGEHLDQLQPPTLLAPEPEPIELQWLWNKRILAPDNSWLVIPLEISENAPTGPVVWTISQGEAEWSGIVEIRLKEGEQEIIAGNQDLGETSVATPLQEAEFFQGVAVEVSPRFLFVADAGWNRIFAANLTPHEQTLLDASVPPGWLIPIAGNGESGPSVDGMALSIPLSEPKGLCYRETEGQPLLYFADTTHHQIRLLHLGDAAVWEAGALRLPGTVTTVAGTGEFGYSGDEGPALLARFFRPWRVRGCTTSLLTVGDVENYRLRAINRSNSSVEVMGSPLTPGAVRTVAGSGALGFEGDGGPATSALISIPKGMASVAEGLTVFSDPENNRLRMVNWSATPQSYSGVSVEPNAIASLGEPGQFDGLDITPGFSHPTGLALGIHGTLFVADTYSHTVKAWNGGHSPVTVAGQTVYPASFPIPILGHEYFLSGFGGPSLGLDAYLASPFDVAFHPARGELYVADEENRVFRRLAVYPPSSPWVTPLPFPHLEEICSPTCTLNTDTGFLESNGIPHAYLGGGGGEFWLKNFAVPAGITLRLVGSRPAKIRVENTVQIHGELRVESGGLPPHFGQSEKTGGSFGSQGSNSSEEAIYGVASLRPICGGQAGGDGSPGGGGLLLACSGLLQVDGAIHADGLPSPENGGSGSGGGIRLVSETGIACSGPVTAQGGGGFNPGGDGRIRLEAPDVACESLPAASIAIPGPLAFRIVP